MFENNLLSKLFFILFSLSVLLFGIAGIKFAINMYTTDVEKTEQAEYAQYRHISVYENASETPVYEYTGNFNLREVGGGITGYGFWENSKTYNHP